MDNLFGVMQGRLLPKYQGRYQAHPIGNWQEEFTHASKLELDCIEFILDFNDAEENPLLRVGGIDEILAVAQNTGVCVSSICADYLMEAPIHSADETVGENAVQVLRRLITAAKSIGASDIVIPCVDQSSLGNAGSIARLKSRLTPVLEIVEEAGINLSLETDLGPTQFHDLLAQYASNRLTVNYDIGNSAALGFNPVEELAAYGDRISDIHIKDRTLGGGPVILGEGHADFDGFFEHLKSYNFNGPFIMQAYRDDEGIEVFKAQMKWIKPYLDRL